MLNALIAIMGDTYGRVSETKQSRGLYNKAMYILERQRLMSPKELANKAYFPFWLHVIERDVDGTGDIEVRYMRYMRYSGRANPVCHSRMTSSRWTRARGAGSGTRRTSCGLR